VAFFIPSALASAELGAAIPEESGAYVWVRMAFGRFAGAVTSVLAMLAFFTATVAAYGGAAGVVGGLSAALTVSIALIVLAYLFVFPAFIALRLRRPELERPSRVPGGTPVAWAVSIMATGWSLLAALCLLWPGLGSGEQDAALPAGFEGERLQFELLVLAPVVLVVALAGVFYVLGRATARAGSES
jgi:glutamate:GABA antiporter